MKGWIRDRLRHLAATGDLGRCVDRIDLPPRARLEAGEAPAPVVEAREVRPPLHALGRPARP